MAACQCLDIARPRLVQELAIRRGTRPSTNEHNETQLKCRRWTPDSHRDVYRSTSQAVHELLHGSTRNMIVTNSRQGLLGLCLVSVTAGQLAPGPVNDIARVAARATTSAPYVTHSQPSAIMDPSLATNTEACAIAGSLLSSCYFADVTYDADDRRQFATAMWSYTKCACCSAPSSLYQECAWSLKSTSPDRLEFSAGTVPFPFAFPLPLWHFA